MKRKARLVLCLSTCFWPARPYAAMVTQNVSDVELHLVGEFIDAVPVPDDQQEFAPYFTDALTASGSITYDTEQPDVDPSDDTGTYRRGTLSVTLPDIGLCASRRSDAMQISCFNDVPNQIPDDQLFAYAEDPDLHASLATFPRPVAFSVGLYGTTAMLAD